MPKFIEFEEKENQIIFNSTINVNEPSNKCNISTPVRWARKFDKKRIKVTIEVIE